MTPSDPDFERKVRDSFARQPLMKTLGAELTTLLPGRCEVSLPYRQEITQQHGFIHAGATAAIADTAAGYAAFSLAPPGSSVLTVEFKINLLAPAKGEKLSARAVVVKAGRTLKVCACEVFAIQEGKETLCALLQATIMILAQKSDRAS